MTKDLNCLKDMYLEEIKKITKKGELTPVDSEAAKKALEAIKMIDDICENCEEDEYEASYGMRRMPEMRYSKRSRHMSRSSMNAVDRMMAKLEDMRLDAPDEDTRMAIDNVIAKLEAY